jgi:alkaline phosphatase
MSTRPVSTLGLGLLAALATLTAAPVAEAAGDAKNVIFFLGDGMGPTTVTAARIFKYGEAGRLTMETFPRTARVKTYSLNAQTTDSAPSMSAYMTGVKMNNDVLAMSPDTLHLPACDATNGHAVPTLLEMAKAAGKAVGAVTTTELTHATPAATYAHICNRDLARAIAVQAVPGGAGFNAALGDGVNVLMGGSQAHWAPQADPSTDKRDLFAELAALGYTVAKTKADFDAVSPAATTKLIGVFSPKSHLDYELDRVKNAVPTQPSLSEMTVKAIDVLQNAAHVAGDKGFFLMVEGGRIDHALHATNAKRALVDTIAFDDAIKAALGKVDLKDTLVVVTADHDHTMAINGYGRRTGPTTAQEPGILGTVQNADGSNALDADGLPYTILAFGNGVRRPDVRGTDDLKGLVEASNGNPKVAAGNVITVDPAASTAADSYYQVAGVGTNGAGSETHGGSDVMLMATGAGSARFKGTIDNTQVFQLVKAALGW